MFEFLVFLTGNEMFKFCLSTSQFSRARFRARTSEHKTGVHIIYLSETARKPDWDIVPFLI
jgi:hypothetical protein